MLFFACVFMGRQMAREGQNDFDLFTLIIFFPVYGVVFSVTQWISLEIHSWNKNFDILGRKKELCSLKDGTNVKEL